MKPPYLPVHLSQPFSRWRPNGKGHKIREEIVATNLCMILPSNNKMASLNTFNNIRNIRIYFFFLRYHLILCILKSSILCMVHYLNSFFKVKAKEKRKADDAAIASLWRNIPSKSVRWINCIRQLFTIYFRPILISFHQTVMNGRQKISFDFFLKKKGL